MDQRRILIKIGGQAFTGEKGFGELARGISAHPEVEVVIVHGGGAEISQALKEARRPTQFVDGIRVTRGADMRIVDQVLSDTVNPRIAGWLEAHGVACCRLSGKTRELLVVKPFIKDGRDYGYVGEVDRVNPRVVREALAEGRVPVISPISANDRGVVHNVNADNAAAALAAALQSTDLVFVTDVPGVRAGGETCARLDIAQTRQLIADGTIQGGMVAKITAGRRALEQGVPRVHIIAWEGERTFRQIVTAQRGGGTVLVC